MDFSDGLKVLTEKILNLKDQIETEEATKTAFIMPFFDLLGYDTRNPLEFVPEFAADVGNKKGEKVDYAIIIDGDPQILIEAKWCFDDLTVKHDHQLVRYFTVTNAKIAILTNGIVYKFYTDLEETNKMDNKPFMEIDLLNIKDNEITELKKFYKSNFDIENILSTAEVLKYSNAIKKLVLTQFEEPEEEFIEYILNQVYDGRKTQNVKDKFKDIVKKSVSSVINDLVRNKLENALAAKEEDEEDIEEPEELTLDNDNKIETTQQEMDGYYIIKSIFAEFTNPERITFKDTMNYFSLLLDDNTRKWVCRLYFNYSNKYIEVPEYEIGGKRISEERYDINNVNDLYNFKDELKEVFDTLEAS